MSQPPDGLSAVFDDLPAWQQDKVLAEVRGAYIYARSAAQRAVARITAEEHPNHDAIFESIWWIAACDGYLFTAFGPRWTRYKSAQPWADLVNGIRWARNQLSHDPLSLSPAFDRWHIVDDVMRLREKWLWAPRDHIPVAEPGRANVQAATAYITAVEGHPMIETITEAVEALRHVNVDDVASFAAGSPSNSGG